MAEASPSYAARIEIQKVDIGAKGGPNAAKQSIGNGVTVLTGSGLALHINSPINNVVRLNDAQVAGLLGYIGLLNEGIDTSAVETAISTLVAAS